MGQDDDRSGALARRASGARGVRAQRLAAASDPRYARVVADGKVHRTSDAYYVERVVIGEMGADGNETRFTYNCYVDPSGALIRGVRGAPPAAGEAR